MKGLAVIADDLTGANENGIHFLRAGFAFQTLIYNRAGFSYDLKKALLFKGFLAVDSETRQKDADEAYARVSAITKSLLSRGIEKIYFKADSTLRGHLGASIQALLERSNAPYAAVCMAFPSAGRTTRNTVQYVDNVPVSRTAFARDPLNPVKSSDIRRVIGRETKLRSAAIGLAVVKSGVKSVEQEIKRLLREGAKILVFDCETNADLKVLGAAVRGCRIFCGASALSAVLCGKGRLRSKAKMTAGRDRVAGIIGSMNPVTRAQLEELTAKTRIKCVYATPDDAVNASIKANFDRKDFVVVLDDGPASKKAVERLIKERGADSAANDISRGLAKIARACGADPKKDAMFFSGGSTAAGACEEFGIRRFSLEGLVDEGIPFLRSLEYETPLVTKSGGFGDKKALMAICNRLKEGVKV